MQGQRSRVEIPDLEVLVPQSLRQQLNSCSALPSPPAVALEIIAMGRDPDASLAQAASLLGKDPAMAAKLMRIANSPLYARRRKTDNLRQAITLLGLDGTLILALSFVMVKAMDSDDGSDLDYSQFWTRSVLCATCSRLLGQTLGMPCAEELFLAGLLHDIGVLALDKLNPELYRGSNCDAADHSRICELETTQFGVDHSIIGGWLLHSWGFPEDLCGAVAGSHDPGVVKGAPKTESFVRCVALAARASALWISAPEDHAVLEIAKLGETWLGLNRHQIVAVLDQVGNALSDVGELYQIQKPDRALADSIVEQAREVLVLRNLSLLQDATTLQRTADSLEERTRELEESNKRDPLTGLFNRRHLDKILHEEFKQATQDGWPLTVLFLDLDHFKAINDIHGHQVGDDVLRGVSQLLQTCCRQNDFVARFGGEEFVVILTRIGVEKSRFAAKRLLRAFRSTKLELGGDQRLQVTASIGMAVQDETHQFASVDEFLEAADSAVYEAKRRGRNQLFEHGSRSAQSFDDLPVAVCARAK